MMHDMRSVDGVNGRHPIIEPQRKILVQFVRGIGIVDAVVLVARQEPYSLVVEQAGRSEGLP